jgi:hypothetical protein
LQLRFISQRVLQQLEMRDAGRIEGHESAVDHGVALAALERLRHFDVAVTDDLAVAAKEDDPAAVGSGDHAKPVIFTLEHPIPDHRMARQSASQAWAAGARERRRAAHGDGRPKSIEQINSVVEFETKSPGFWLPGDPLKSAFLD